MTLSKAYGSYSVTQLAALQQETAPALAALSRSNPLPKKLFIFAAGQSNMEGAETGYTVLTQSRDVPNRKVGEVSQGINKTTYYAAPVGERMTMREPAQDDAGGMSCKLVCGKHLVTLAPEIEDVVFYCCSIGGTGFADDTWNPGDAHLEASITAANVFLDANPEYMPCIIWAQGANEASEAWTALQYETALIACVARMRAGLRRGADAVFIAATTNPVLAASNFGPGGVPGTGTYPQIIDAQRRTASYIDNAGFIEMGKQLGTADGRHFDEAGLRFMGERYAERIIELLTQGADVPRVYGEVRMRYDAAADDFRDVNGSNHRIFSPVLVSDVTRGWVLNCVNTGFNTDITLPTKRYTKAVRVKFTADPIGEQSLLAGKLPSQAIGHLWSIRTVTHDAAGGLPTSGVSVGGVENVVGNPVGERLVVDTWHSVTLTYDGVSFRIYKDGVLLARGAQTAGVTEPAGDAIVQVGIWGTVSITNARFEEIVVSDEVWSAAKVAAWHAEA